MGFSNLLAVSPPAEVDPGLWSLTDWADPIAPAADRIDPATGMLLRRLDPRPDLCEDHDLWVAVLSTAHQMGDHATGGLLHGLRCGGARMEKRPSDAAPGWRLHLDYYPCTDPAGAADGNVVWQDPTTFRLQWLEPKKDAIKAVFILATQSLNA